MSIYVHFMHWLVKSSRTQEWTGHIHVRKGMGGTPGRSNLNKLHIFEPVSQCSLPYDGVQSWHTPVAAKGSRLCIPMEALQLENQAGRGCSTKQAWNSVVQPNWPQKIFQVWGQGVRWVNLVWMLHKLKTWHIPCCATVIHLPFVWELFCRPDLRQFPVFYSWFEWSHSICHLVASPHSH